MKAFCITSRRASNACSLSIDDPDKFMGAQLASRYTASDVVYGVRRSPVNAAIMDVYSHFFATGGSDASSESAKKRMPNP